MQLHRPKDINSLNEEFFKNEFSGNAVQEEPIIAAEPEFEKDVLIQGEIDRIIVENESDIKSGYVAGQIERLSKVQYENRNSIFHEFPDDIPEEPAEELPFDESGLFDSFPEIDFDPSVFNDDNDLTDREIRKESVRKAKEEAKITIENEKEKIREQKKLEKTVQKPFGKRKTAVVLMVLFTVINLLCIGCFGVFSVMADNGNSLTLSDTLTVHYVDGLNISTASYRGSLIAVAPENIQGSRNVLFTDDEGDDVIGKVIAIGDGIYGIDIGEKVVKAESESITGIVKAATPDISLIYTAFTAFGLFPVIMFAFALALTLLLSVRRIKKLNGEIKKLEENYNII